MAGGPQSLPSAASPARQPVRPAFVLRVGITGHRWDKLPRDRIPELTRRLGGLLGELEAVAGRLAADPDAGFRAAHAPARAPELRLISALAEGADRLLVQAAPAGWRLGAMLPFPPEVYAQDFREPGSADELRALLERAGREAGVLVLDGRRDVPGAFEPVGTAICLNSDVLVAIWDGEPGRPGGTGSVVALAGRMGIPVVRVTPDGGGPPWLHRPDLADAGAGRGLTEIEAALRTLAAAPPTPEAADPAAPHDLREVYFREGWKAGRRGQLYAAVLRVLGYQWRGVGALRHDLATSLRRRALPYLTPFAPDYAAKVRARWHANWSKLGVGPEILDPLLRTTLPDHYGWASNLANYYAGRYRSSFLWAYGLSWIAVGFGAARLASYLLGWRAPLSVFWFAAGELGLLLAILTVVLLARRGHFHERWLAYRSLTERLRSLTYTLPLARASVLSVAGGPGQVPRVESWVDWMHRAVVREVGFLPGRLTPERLEQARVLLVAGELAEQIGYHDETATRLLNVKRRLHRATDLVFFAAVLLALVHFVEAALEAWSHGEARHVFNPETGTLLGVIGLTAPAFAAAVHGFLSQGEFEETAVRSRATERQLRELQRLGNGPLRRAGSEALGNLAMTAARTMDAELGGWFTAYQFKDVPLP